MSVVKPSPNMRNDIERVVHDTGMVMKTDVEAIVETCETKGTSILQWHIEKTVESTFEDAFQGSYFHSNIGLKIAIFNVVEQTLSEMDRYDGAPPVLEAHTRDLVQNKLLSDTIFQAVLRPTVFIVPIAETVNKLVSSAVDECRFCSIGKTLTTSAIKDVAREWALPCPARPPKIPCDYKR